jgi:hypothetical protein
VTISHRRAPGFYHCLAGDELVVVPLWPRPRVVITRRTRAGRARGHGPAKGLATGLASWAWPGEDPVAVGYSEA